MVTPDGQLNYIGANVQDIVGSTAVQSMDLFDHVNEIRFTQCLQALAQCCVQHPVSSGVTGASTSCQQKLVGNLYLPPGR